MLAIHVRPARAVALDGVAPPPALRRIEALADAGDDAARAILATLRDAEAHRRGRHGRLVALIRGRVEALAGGRA